MNSIRINILNPKAMKLLKSLAEMNLISISDVKENEFLNVIEGIRNKKKTPLSLDEITKEVEIVRSKRYAGKNL